METFSALLALCAGKSPVTGEFPAQRPVTRSFVVFFDLHLNNRLSKHWRGWWCGTPPRPLWRTCNGSKANLRYLIAATGLVILLKLNSNLRFAASVILKSEGKTTGHLFYTTSSCVHHFKPSVDSNWNYSPEMPNLGKNLWIFVTCDLEIWSIGQLFYAV